MSRLEILKSKLNQIEESKKPIIKAIIVEEKLENQKEWLEKHGDNWYQLIGKVKKKMKAQDRYVNRQMNEYKQLATQ